MHFCVHKTAWDEVDCENLSKYMNYCPFLSTSVSVYPFLFHTPLVGTTTKQFSDVLKFYVIFGNFPYSWPLVIRILNVIHVEMTLPDKIWADLNSPICQVPAVCCKNYITIPKFITVPDFTHMHPFVSYSTLWRSDDFIKFSSFLKFEGWLYLHIRKTRLILPAEPLNS